MPASSLQAQGIEQINRAVSKLERVIKQNSANAEESVSAPEKMSGLARNFTDFVSDLAMLVGTAGNGLKGASPKEYQRGYGQRPEDPVPVAELSTINIPKTPGNWRREINSTLV
jgi:hypothetical protein